MLNNLLASATATTLMQESIFNSEAKWQEHWQQRMAKKANEQVCSRCVYDETVPGISFDNDGVCSFCQKHDELMEEYPGGQQGWDAMERTAKTIKQANKRKPYDVLVGVSGGADSSYLLHLAKVELGLRPLAVHFDNTWNSEIATNNIQKMLDKLDIDLYTHVVRNDEFDDSCRSILKAGVPDLEMQTDLALAATLNQAANKYKIRYQFEGHSFRSEGISPIGWQYMDSKYLQSIQKQFGSKKLDSLPHMWLSSQLKWMLLNRIKKIRPLWLIDYDKESNKKMLTEKYGWEWYGGHHLENRITAFYHSFFLPRRWDFDTRTNGFSALVRSGQMTRDEGLNLVSTAHHIEPELLELVKERLNFSEEEFEALMQLPKKSYQDFKTYKKTFERMRPFFYLMAKMDLIPWSFYFKYTKPA